MTNPSLSTVRSAAAELTGADVLRMYRKDPNGFTSVGAFLADLQRKDPNRFHSLATFIGDAQLAPKLLSALKKFRNDPQKLVDLFAEEPMVRRAYLSRSVDGMKGYWSFFWGDFAQHQDLARIVEARECAKDAVAQILASEI